MSHQTGIQGSESLRQCFTKCKAGKIRLLKVSIENEQLVPATLTDANSSSWDKVYDSLILAQIEEEQPCYILFRLDTKNSSGYEWLLLSWCPDDAPIRQKMLYASTKATLRQEFGSSQIADELHGTVKGDVNLEGFLRHQRAEVSPAPLTSREEELELMKRSEVHADIGVRNAHETIGAVNFPMRDGAEQAISDLVKGSYNYVQLAIDIDKEELYLANADTISIDKLPSKVSEINARYHIYLFKHTHEGDYMESYVFIYSMPGYKCSVKEKMMYSTCMRPLTHNLSVWGLDFAKKLEIESGSELTEKFLYEEIHPTKNLHRPLFDRPKGPAHRGPKRLI